VKSAVNVVFRVHISEFTQYCVAFHGSNIVAKCALMQHENRRYRVCYCYSRDINRDAICSARLQRDSAKYSFPQWITLSARVARETRQKFYAGCDWLRVREIIFSVHSFVGSFIRGSIGRRTFDRSRIAIRYLARSRRNVKTLRTIYDTGFWLLPLFYGTCASFLHRYNHRMNGKWVKSVSGKIEPSEKLSMISRHDNENDRKCEISVESSSFVPLHLRCIC